MHHVAMSLAAGSLAIAAGIVSAQADPLPGAPAVSSTSETSTSASPTAFAPLPGRWVRPDGGYIISIKSVDAGGKPDASYANPNPLPVYTRDGDRRRPHVESILRAVGGWVQRLDLYAQL
jgi:hypothetical protein